MKWAICCILVACIIVLSDASPTASLQTAPEDTVRGLIGRVMPTHLNDISLELIDTQNGFDVFEIDNGATAGSIILRGSSGVALASAFNHYLKYQLNLQVFSWSGSQLDNIPEILSPVSQLTRIVTKMKYRYYQNVCTVSYSSPWWSWERWQREIDWMAMNGINLPLAFTGQEAVWYDVWTSLGMSDADVRTFFGGPAFLAWQRMGNIKEFGGPMTMSWINAQKDLQIKILARMRSYGMSPVLSAFAGHVPDQIAQLYPNSTFRPSSQWNGFNGSECCVKLLEPTDPLFARIGQLTVQANIKLFGTDHFYNADTFNELTPSSSDPTYLKHASSACFESMRAADPQAVWIMQGWLFFNDQIFWQPPQIQGLLSGVPNDGMIILDLFSDVSPVYNRTQNYYGKPFIWCMLHNFGGNVGLYGRINVISSEPYAALTAPGSTMVGIGLTMEGINQNYIVYELMTENAWYSSAIDYAQWTQQFIARRYGITTDSTHPLQQAWSIMIRSVYQCSSTKQRGVTKSLIEIRPNITMTSDEFMPTNLHYNPRDLIAVWKLYLQFLQEGGDSKPVYSRETFLFDVVDITRQVFSNLMITFHQQLITAFQNSQVTEFNNWARLIESLISDFDTLLASSDGFLLGNWIQDAISFATNGAESALYQYNARNQITLWGPTGQISDYASKQWAGLVQSYYAPRWHFFIEALGSVLASGLPPSSFDINSYRNSMLQQVELPWQTSSNLFPTQPSGDSITVVLNLFDKYQRFFPST